jgi:hypothetical protein
MLSFALIYSLSWRLWPFPLDREQSLVLLQQAAVDIAALSACLDTFVELAQVHASTVTGCYGRYLRDILWCKLYETAVLPAPAPFPWGHKLERLAPDNPLILTPQGTLAGWQEATGKHYLQVQNYRASLTPGRRPGRPKGAKARKKHAPSQSRIDPTLAARAYHMALDGAHWTEIARVLLPTHNLYDPTQSAQARGRVSRLIERGRLNAQRQP